ncbi:Rho GTPase activation protein, partial [Blyttiomyces helicus]
VNTKIILESGVDFESKPILAFYAHELPSSRSADYDLLLTLLLARLDQFVESDYAVVLFAGGVKNQPSWTWMFKVTETVNDRYRKNLKNLYIVHPTIWPKMLMQSMLQVASPKFARKVLWVENLSRLSKLVPIEQLRIPDIIYEMNVKFEHSSPPQTAPSSAQQSATDFDSLHNRMFGAPLEEIMGTSGERGLPRVVVECIAFVTDYGLGTDGIFRRSPASRSVQEAKAAYDRGHETIDLEALGGVHLACVLLKLYFRELPEPIIRRNMYDVIRAIQGKKTNQPSPLEQALYIRNTVLPLFSAPTRLLLSAVFGLLNQVYENSERNLMTSKNLAIVWGPNFVRSQDPLIDYAIC